MRTPQTIRLNWNRNGRFPNVRYVNGSVLLFSISARRESLLVSGALGHSVMVEVAGFGGIPMDSNRTTFDVSGGRAHSSLFGHSRHG